jgi:hypothetical protein
MNNKVILSLPLLLIGLTACHRSSDVTVVTVGTTADMQFSDSGPAVVTKALADRLEPGMSQDDAISVVRDAAEQSPAAKSTIETIVAQSKLNTIRYDLTLSQGKRKLVLRFQDGKLTDVQKVEPTQ